jgi:hypothetical protein
VRKRAIWIIPSVVVVALLALLVVLPASAAPSGADANAIIVLSNGTGTATTATTAGTVFYSAQTLCGDGSSTCNIAKASVSDTDFSSQRTGIARFANQSANTTAFEIDGVATILEGEKTSVETFTATAGQTIYTVKYTIRDADGDGTKENGQANTHDVQVKVNSVALAAGTYTANFSEGDGTLSRVVLGSASTVGDKVEITYEYSEFAKLSASTTPLAAAASHSATFGAGYAAATTSVLVVGAAPSTGTITVSATPAIASNNEVIVTFKYDVQETVTDLVTFSSASLGARGLTRKVDGIESGAATGVFEASVGLLSGADFDKIVTAAGLSGVTTIDGIEGAAGITGTDLATRIAVMAPLLGFPTSGSTGVDQNEATSDDLLVALLVPVADGEVFTASYVDGTATRSDTTNIDMKAPTLTLISPTDASFTKALSSVKVRVTDDASAGGKASGLSLANASKLVIGGAVTSAAVSAANTSSILVASNSFEITGSVTSIVGTTEGKMTWWAPTKDNAGNIPVFTDSRTKTQVATGVANPSVQGAGDPANVTTTPGNTFSVTVDTAAPTALTTAAVKTGGDIDIRLTVVPTGSHTGSTHATILTDSAADFVTAGIAVGDKITNLTDGSSCLVTTITATTLTCAATLAAVAGGTGSVDADFDQNDNYTVSNPELGNIKVNNTILNSATVEFNLGTGGSALNASSVEAGDFKLVDAAGVEITINSATVDAKGNKVLLALGSNLGTADVPKLSIAPDTNDSITDTAGNSVATVTGTSAITAVDRIAPIITIPVIVGTAGAADVQKASNGTVTIDFNTGEASATTPTVTAAYLIVDGASPFTLKQDTAATLGVTSTGVNSWQATLTITTITGASRAGLVNVVISLTDAAGNTATAGKTDPDGTVAATAGTLVAGAVTFEFDNKLNDGDSTLASVYVVSPNTNTTAVPKTDTPGPFITINLDKEGLEDQLTNANGTVNPIKIDTHAAASLTSATWTFPDATTKDVLAGLVSADTNSYVYAPTGLVAGTHTLEVQAKDSSGNVSTSVGSATATSFKLTLVVTARTAYKNPLKPGFNLVSFPAKPDASVTAIDDAIPSTSPIDFVMTYDNASGLWLVATRDTDAASATYNTLVGNLTTIDETHAYWVQTDRFFDFELLLPRTTAGAAVFPTAIQVFTGWNLVPVGDLKQGAAGTTIDPDLYFSGTKWSAAITFDPTRNQYIRTSPDATTTCTAVPAVPNAVPAHPCLENAKGYFVYVTADGVVIP